MNRQEQVGIALARDLYALIERNEDVGRSRHHHVVAFAGAQRSGNLSRDGQHDVFLDTDFAARAGIDAAVAGVDDDHGFVASL